MSKEYINRELLENAFEDENKNGNFVFTANWIMEIVDNLPTADVVPKSEVESILDEIEKTIRAALILIDFSYKHNQKEIQCKKECYKDFLGYIAELKKKYTEGEYGK